MSEEEKDIPTGQEASTTSFDANGHGLGAGGNVSGEEEKKDALGTGDVAKPQGEQEYEQSAVNTEAKKEEDSDSDDRSYAEDPNDILEIEGFICPKHLVTKISPMEFEEMVHLFKTYDANGSGDIDKHEARKILQAMELDASLEKAEELIALVDKDGSGEIEFDEFCEFIVLVKEGDERYAKFDAIMANVKETPLGKLEAAAKTQGFSVRFQTKEVREATATNPPVYVVELEIDGKWFERDPDTGETTSKRMTRKFQGLGQSNREAKYNACKAGTIKLAQMMPGTRFKEGDFDTEWYEWIDVNLARGVDPIKIVSILAAKGFHPHRNDALMQRIVTWQSFDLFLARNGNDFSLEGSTVLNTEFRFWMEKCSRKGIDGSVILKVLQDRGLDLEKEFGYFAQKLRNNELGYVMDINGMRTKFLSFWTACADGSVEDVLLYVKSRQPVNEEMYNRMSGETERPLAIAASEGHTAVLKVLIEAKAEINAIDRRGRTALHRAAMNGHLEACKYLVEAGIWMFEGDFSGNSALHLAAFYNHDQVVNFLAWRSQEHTRTVSSDKVRPQEGKTFNELAKFVFEKIMDKKLTWRDLRRVEKTWLHECAVMFRSLCDTKPKAMLGHSCEEIMFDVLTRFDPRPETGVFIIRGVAGEQVFIPTIPSPVELSSMLRYLFRQASIDSVNSWKRTALHVACDNNKVDSHQRVIYTLMDTYGCNTYLRDMHGRRPIDLLMLDRAFPGVPSTTQVREEFIFTRREQELSSLTKFYQEKETVRRHERQAGILEDCAKFAEQMSLDLWDVVKTACIKIGKVEAWEKYEDPESLNFFYVKKPTDFTDGQRYGPYMWTHIEEPLEIKVKNEWLTAVKYLTQWRSVKLNVFGRWQHYRCTVTKLDYYYDEPYMRLRFNMPKEATWAMAQAECKRIETVGYAKEWDAIRDLRSGNIFYKDNRSGECTWDKPIDAVIPDVTERFCTAFGAKGKVARQQKYYVCEQCNRAWKTSKEGAKVNMYICEPCINRCHVGHKGVRFVKNQSCVCNCDDCTRVAGCKCNATEISASQLIRQRDAYQQRVEASRAREANILMPPIFAMVPSTWPDGTKKRLTGWQLCRRPALQGFDQFGAPKMGEGDETTVTSTSTHPSQTGSLFRGNPVPIEALDEIQSLDEYPYLPPHGLPAGWVEVSDPEEPEEIRKKSRVLVKMVEGFEFMYATIVESVSQGFYKVKFDVPVGNANGPLYATVQRERIVQVITRPSFYCHVESGQSAWTIEDACGKNGPEKIFQSSPLCLTGTEWLDLYKNSTARRVFGKIPEMYEEMVDSRTGILFYANVDVVKREAKALRIQTAVRRFYRFPLPYLKLTSYAYSVYPTDEVKHLMRLRGGWSYLRRRAYMIGEFLSSDQEEWEEWVDKETSEYFYWQEQSNRYSWDKPEVPERKLEVIEYIPIGTEVLFRFPKERDEEICLVTRLRFDDETGGDCYDIVCKTDNNKVVKWLPRMRIKLKPAGNEEMHMKRFEKQWKNVLRRVREKEQALEKRRKELQDAADLKRAEEMKLGIVREEDADSKISPAILMMRTRQTRLEAEAKMTKDEIERIEGAARREQTRQLVQLEKEAAFAKGMRLSRADILAMTRAIEMRLTMEDRILKRNAAKLILDQRKKENEDRIKNTEKTLREMEVAMTSPRSGRRRTLMRRLHCGMRRQEDCYMVCEWGCGDWVCFGFDQLDHQSKRCTKRILPCSLGCKVKNSEEDWLKPAKAKSDEEIMEEMLTMSAEEIEKKNKESNELTTQQFHEQHECIKRLVICPRQCLEWVCFEVLEEHMNELCTKRPAEPIFCRLGCGAKFGGLIEKLIEAEDELMLHETEQCDFRIVRCNWSFADGTMCAAQMQAKDRAEHRDYHLVLLGVSTYTVAGTYLYRVPKGITRLKVQAWGAGGGSGFFKHRRCGAGGGGAYIECMLDVEAYDILEVVVGSGGGGGAIGTEIESMHIDQQREIMKVRRTEETFLSKEERIARKANTMQVIDAECGITLGGVPGGGEGYGGGGYWACGGGGGYTIVSKRTPKGNQALIVAAGGGGGGSVPGVPGGGMDGILPGIRVDPICGVTATASAGGAAGDSGTSFNSKWPAQPGTQWTGGNGSEFGAGGGGGYFGGGGGGTQPGIGGGGGGGSSYVYAPKAYDYLIIPGDGHLPGGLKADPPQASGAGEWDKVGGFVGQGAIADVLQTKAGNAGCVRISKPGFY